MEKEYKQPIENNENNIIGEPMASYGIEEEIIFSPPLTEEELANAITGDELREYMHKFIDDLFDKNESAIHPKH